ncbi:MAG: hypothetical protein AAF725_09725 [Acidobacteriota bacterium]
MDAQTAIGGSNERASRALWAPLALLAIAASAFSVRSTDVFWHLASGRWILEHGSIPKHDPFRFTSAGREWVDHEWLFQIVLYLAEAAGGLPALIALRVSWVLLLAATLALALTRIGLPRAEVVLVAGVALLGARPRFLLRPELLTVLAIAALFLLVREIALSRHTPRRAVGGLLALTVVWANVHGMALLSPALTGLYLLGCQIHNKSQGRLLSQQDPPPYPGVTWTRVFALPAALLAALLINPYGWHLFAVALGITGAMRGLEAYNPEWVPAWVAPQPFLGVGVAATLLLVLLTWRATRRLHLPTLLPTLFLLAIAATAVRHQALFFLAAAFLAGESLRLLRPSREDSRRVAALATALLMIAAAWCAAPPSSGPLKPRQGRFTLGLGGIERGKFPERAADFLADRPEIGPLFNSFAYGGYLLWRLYPPRQVFHEGRMELQPTLLREIGEARSGNREWDAMMGRYGATGALVAIDPRPRPSLVWNEATQKLEPDGYFTANTLLFPSDTYALVYWDDLSMLFLDRRRDQPADLIEGEYRYIHPEDPRPALERAAADPRFRARALLEIERKLRQDPDSRLAREIRAALERVGRRR